MPREQISREEPRERPTGGVHRPDASRIYHDHHQSQCPDHWIHTGDNLPGIRINKEEEMPGLQDPHRQAGASQDQVRGMSPEPTISKSSKHVSRNP